ncbi:hypothetical protein H257_15332 [Aphanomyces astaci]|uniref:valine--tRNA ligase n=1 Tax=Aphanomyces astaci TaxID=112090 RepID=W4FMK2_APHAT|nr:hypothetical protein H257_15332 [Aphanomyces astaci]ETV68747.1 hypothetical protein H257_15332 [Aphanomyces astaci]|eukprot:XP_009841701.1 hypothetical protein H257_15332 [Aphanomyces astaci]
MHRPNIHPHTNAETKTSANTTTKTTTTTRTTKTTPTAREGKAKTTKKTQNKTKKNKNKEKKNNDKNRTTTKDNKTKKENPRNDDARKEGNRNNKHEDHKKQVTATIATGYHPVAREAARQPGREKEGCAKPDDDKTKTETKDKRQETVSPPPNATRARNLGHPRNGTHQQKRTQRHRMQGCMQRGRTAHQPRPTSLPWPQPDFQPHQDKPRLKDKTNKRNQHNNKQGADPKKERNNHYQPPTHHHRRNTTGNTDHQRANLPMHDRTTNHKTKPVKKHHDEQLIYRPTPSINATHNHNNAIANIQAHDINRNKHTKPPQKRNNPARKNQVHPRTTDRDAMEQHTHHLNAPNTRHLEKAQYDRTNSASQTPKPIQSQRVPEHSATRAPLGSHYIHIMGARWTQKGTTAPPHTKAQARRRQQTIRDHTQHDSQQNHPPDTQPHRKRSQHPGNRRRRPRTGNSEWGHTPVRNQALNITPQHDQKDHEPPKRQDPQHSTRIHNHRKIKPKGHAEIARLKRDQARPPRQNPRPPNAQPHGKVDNKMRLGKDAPHQKIVEPLVKPQWFVNCEQMAQDAMAAVRSKELTILPEHHEKTWFRWLENIRDWCISRQLWWGHRIPAYFATIVGEPFVDPNAETTNDRWFAGLTEHDARLKAAAKLHVDPSQIELKQDEDVLDTWVSAGLFPFAVFGWPDNQEVDDFYPTDLLETGYDILFFWVVRMVFMGQKLTGKLPFHTVYLHSIVRDKYGRKMSKSLGNVVDPLEVIAGCTLDTLLAKLDSGNLPEKEVEKAKKGQTADFPNGIPECGADALRFGLLAYQQQVGDINLDIQRLVGYRNFCNKLWNATRFAMSHLDADDGDAGQRFHDGVAASVLSNPVVHARDRFILSRLHATIAAANTALAAYSFGEVTTALYNFWLYDVCDVYLELVKPVMAGTDAEAKKTAQQTLYLCLEFGLRLLHPIMPFVTEELWQRLPGHRSEASIVIAAYPEAHHHTAWANPDAEAGMDLVKDIIHAGRSLRAEYGLANSARPACFLATDDPVLQATIEAQVDDFCTLSKAGETKVLLGTAPPAGCAIHVLSDKLQLHVLLSGLVDFANEITKLDKKLQKLLPSLVALKKKRSKDDYTTKVPAAVRDADDAKWDALNKEKHAITTAIDAFTKCQHAETKP